MTRLTASGVHLYDCDSPLKIRLWSDVLFCGALRPSHGNSAEKIPKEGSLYRLCGTISAEFSSYWRKLRPVILWNGAVWRWPVWRRSAVRMKIDEPNPLTPIILQALKMTTHSQKSLVIWWTTIRLNQNFKDCIECRSEHFNPFLSGCCISKSCKVLSKVT